MNNLSKIFSLVSDVPNREKRRRRTLVPRNVGIAVGMNLDEQGARLVVGVDWSIGKSPHDRTVLNLPISVGWAFRIKEYSCLR